MTCPNCRTLSCYICRQVIVGYDHFSRPPPYTGPPDPSKVTSILPASYTTSHSSPLQCNLWDPVEQRHNNEVIAAAEKAIEEYKTAHPDVTDEALNVDLPAPVVDPPQQAVQAAHFQAAQMQMQAIQMQAARLQAAGVRLANWNGHLLAQQRMAALGPAPGPRRRRR